MRDPLSLCIALGPLALYILLLAALNLGRRPLLTTGARDTAALGVALVGLVIVGPMRLFVPDAATVRFGTYVWVMLLALYGLSVTLLVLLWRPRLVIYNISADELRPTLAEVVGRLDADARWAGDSLVLPRLGVQLTVEAFAHTRNVQLVSAGPQQNYAGWRQLELALGQELAELRVSRNPYGYVLGVFGAAMMAGIVYALAAWPQAVDEGLRQMLRP
jgi:hypothetical protein